MGYYDNEFYHEVDRHAFNSTALVARELKNIANELHELNSLLKPSKSTYTYAYDEDERGVRSGDQ